MDERITAAASGPHVADLTLATAGGGLLSDTTFWVAIAFVIFVAIVVWKGGATILGKLDSRADVIRSELEEAEKLREEAQHLLAEFKRKQRDANEEAEAILAQAREEAERLKVRAQEELEISLKRREQLAMDRIAQAEAQAQTQVRDMAADLAVAATRKILTDKLDKAAAEKLIDATIKDLPAKLH